MSRVTYSEPWVTYDYGNSSEIKVTIDFRSNFVHWIFIIWELHFLNKKAGVPMLIKEHWAIENASF